jgi:imidazolonepropionase-like amidohydrolase
MKRRILLAAAAALATAAPALAETIAIVNAKILTMGAAGDLTSGTVVVRDGKIVTVAAGNVAPSDARIIDASGRVITPGMVATVSPLAVNDIVGSGPGGIGTSNALVSAAFDIQYSIDPNSPQIPEARVEGVTRAIVTPTNMSQGGRAPNTKIFAGQAVAIHLGDGADLVIKPHAALVMEAGEIGAQLAGGGQGAQLALLEQALADIRDFARDRTAYDQGKMRSLLPSKLDLQALVPLVEGREPLLVEVNRASDIRHILAIAGKEKIKVILSGASEAWMVASEIAAAKVPVILDADENEAFSFDSLHSTYENAAILQRAGVLVAYKPSVARIMFLIRTPRFVAGRSVRYGMSHHDALAAITINPAKMFGLADRFGSIEPGKDADLVIWSGDPLETTTVAESVMIKGKEQPMTSRGRALRDRYIGTIRRTVN